MGSMGAVAASVVLLSVVGLGAGPASAAGHGNAAGTHPHTNAQKRTARGSTTTFPVKAFTQEFSTTTKLFCPTGGGNAPCDGNGTAGDYGTIDRVPGGYSNGGFGNYAPATPALDTARNGGYMAVVSGTGDGNQGTGCPGVTADSNPGEACTGPFALFGAGAAAGAENVYPSHGFTVTDDLYLSPTTVNVAGTLVDDDVELNNSSGTFGIDNVISACAESTGSGLGFVLTFDGHGSPGSCSGTPVVTEDGWYRFVFTFSNDGGNALLTESVLSEHTGTVVATSGALAVGGGASSLASNWGGPGYFWLPSEDVSGLPLANFALRLGSQLSGHAVS
jgi:hypothetical protein